MNPILLSDSRSSSWPGLTYPSTGFTNVKGISAFAVSPWMLINFTSSPLVLAFLIAFIGALRALSYNSSIFHGVSGSINRTGRVAIHESLLAAGLICGSSLGGIIYQKFSMTVVYYFCGAIVFFGAVMQSGLYLLLKKPNNEIIRENQ